MKINEYQAKTLFSSFGIPVERHVLCHSVEEALSAYERIKGTVVVKAQVLTGGRGKAGGVKLAKNKEEVARYARSILSMSIKGLPVKKILVSEAVHIVSEYYLSFAIDRNERSVLLMISSEGGMDIEEVARDTPEMIHRFNIDPMIGIPHYSANNIAFRLFNKIDKVSQFSLLLQNLYHLLISSDASLVEINPLVLTNEGQLIAIDGKMTFDDNALYRHPELTSLAELTEDEKTEAQAKQNGFSYVRMDGEIGCMVNGAGLAMTTMDMIKLYGGEPANFLDIGGSSNPEKVVNAMRILLKHPKIKVVLINIFGGITRCDDVANGLLIAFKQIENPIPVVVRLEGTNGHKGREILVGSRFKVAKTMGEATRLAVESSLAMNSPKQYP